MSSNNPRMTQNQPQPVTPTAGDQTRTYIRVVKGRKIIPNRGTRNALWKARLTSGVKSQVKSSTSRGAEAAASANKHPHPKGMVVLLIGVMIGLCFLSPCQERSPLNTSLALFD